MPGHLLDDMTLEEIKQIILDYKTKEAKKREYNKNYYKTEKGKESVKKSQKKYYAKKKALKGNEKCEGNDKQV